MGNGSNVSRLLTGKKADSDKYRTNIYVTRDVYRRFQQLVESMDLTVTAAFDAMMADFIETNSPRPISSAPKRLKGTEDEE